MIFFSLPVGATGREGVCTRFEGGLVHRKFLVVRRSICIEITAAHRSTRFLRGEMTDFTPTRNLIRSLVVARGRCSSVQFLTKSVVSSTRGDSSEAIVV